MSSILTSCSNVRGEELFQCVSRSIALADGKLCGECMSQVLARGSRHTLVPLQAHMCPDNHIVPTFCELIVKSNICRELK
jgi:hypothetical protein